MHRDPEALARDRAAALSLLHEWTESEALRRHAYAVEAAVRAYARRRGADEDAWGCVALLHDFDYERHPTLDKHPQDGAAYLRDAGYPEWFIRAVLSHANHLQDVAARRATSSASCSHATSWRASCMRVRSCARRASRRWSRSRCARS